MPLWPPPRKEAPTGLPERGLLERGLLGGGGRD